jgi:hypothetical protein
MADVRLSPMRVNPQRNAGRGTLPSGGAADASGEIALNRAAREGDGMHVDVVLLRVQQDVDEDLSRRGDTLGRLVGVRRGVDSTQLCGEVDSDRAALGVRGDVGIPDTRDWFGRHADPGHRDVIADRSGS